MCWEVWLIKGVKSASNRGSGRNPVLCLKPGWGPKKKGFGGNKVPTGVSPPNSITVKQGLPNLIVGNVKS